MAQIHLQIIFHIFLSPYILLNIQQLSHSKNYFDYIQNGCLDLALCIKRIHRLIIYNKFNKMKKKQAEEYFQQLKKVDKAKSMKLAQVVNILTGGNVSTQNYKEFIDYLNINQFGEYNFIDQNIERKDWRLLPFSEFYELLKAIKDFMAKREKRQIKMRENSENQIQISTSRNSEAEQGKKILEMLDQIGFHVDEMGTKAKQQKNIIEKWNGYRIKIIKKLMIIFDYYRKLAFEKGQTFDKNRKLAECFDLRIFMKYLKEFQLLGSFSRQNIIRFFKKQAINTIWLDFDRFVNTHMLLIDFKEETSNNDRYLKLRGLNNLLSSDKIKKMLNVRRDHIVALVQGHTGAYKQDIVRHLEEKSRERRERIQKKWSGKSIKTEGNQSKSKRLILERLPSINIKKSNSYSKIRAKTELSPSIYDQLRLPKLRLKQHRQESIYQNLQKLDLSHQQQSLRKIIDVSDNEEYLSLLLKEQERKGRYPLKLKSKSNNQKPRMRFS